MNGRVFVILMYAAGGSVGMLNMYIIGEFDWGTVLKYAWWIGVQMILLEVAVRIADASAIRREQRATARPPADTS